MINKKSLNNLKKRKKFGEQPQHINRKGQPPKTMTSLLTELKAAGYERVSPAMVVEAYEILLGLSEEKIKEIILDLKQPMSLRIVGRAMMSKDGVKMLCEMMDRAHGKAIAKTEHSGKIETEAKVSIDYSKLSDETLKEITNAVSSAK
jgi:hypothetical protein